MMPANSASTMLKAASATFWGLAPLGHGRFEKQSMGFQSRKPRRNTVDRCPCGTLAQSKQAAFRQPCFKQLIYQYKNGAGERIRTVDPNLGKVMLYP